jgi:PAS domain S-box-containing protein
MRSRPHGATEAAQARPHFPISLDDLAQALDHSDEGFALTDPEGNYVYLNEAHLRIYGYERAPELLGRSWRTLYSPEWVRHFEQSVLPLLPEDKVWRGQVVGRRRDGSSFLASVTLTLLPDGKITCNCRDESAVRPAETSRATHPCICPTDRAALRELGELLVAGLPRKLRRPVDLISGYAGFCLGELEAGRAVEPATLREGLAAVLGSGKEVAAQMRRLELVAALAAAAQAAGDQSVPDPNWTSRLARACRERAAQSGRAEDLHVRLEQADPAITYPALECLVLELLSNALSSSRKGDRVEVCGTAPPVERDYVIRVCDEGVGLADHDLRGAADHPFGQSEPCGLGLAVVRYILRRVGGTLSADVSGDSSTCLRVSLPLKNPGS